MRHIALLDWRDGTALELRRSCSAMDSVALASEVPGSGRMHLARITRRYQGQVHKINPAHCAVNDIVDHDRHQTAVKVSVHSPMQKATPGK